jgi:hypothetical protein
MPKSATISLEHRHNTSEQPTLGGVPVREDDIESDNAIRAIARLFRGMAILLLVLAGVQIVTAVTATVALSIGVLGADVVRLVIFAGLLWGVGDIAVLIVRSHYDVRATRILVARVEHLLKVQAGTAPRDADRGP